jgi:hypothetical protein
MNILVVDPFSAVIDFWALVLGQTRIMSFIIFAFPVS